MKEIDPLNFLRAVYMNAELPLSVRMRAAIELLPFTHPKLAVTAVVSENDFATILDRRLARIQQMKTKINHLFASLNTGIELRINKDGNIYNTLGRFIDRSFGRATHNLFLKKSCMRRIERI